MSITNERRWQIPCFNVNYPSLMVQPDLATKEAFHVAANACLRAVGKKISQISGMQLVEVRDNRSGNAVPGEVTACYADPTLANGLYVQISGIGIDLNGIEREDGLLLMARRRRFEQTPANRRRSANPTQPDGPNHYGVPTAGTNVHDVSQWLLSIDQGQNIPRKMRLE